jgi:hypothetical protein
MHFACAKLLILSAALLANGVALADNRQPTPESGNRNAAALVTDAARYEHAEGVPRDFGRAIELYCAAAKAGNADGQYGLGWMYANGRGVNRDDAIAAHLFNLAAQQGHVQAQNMQKLASTAKPVVPPCLVPPPKVVQAPAADELLPGREPNYPRGHIYNVVGKVSPKYEVDPQLVLAFIAVESGFNANAVSPKNAQGLMQLIPETAPTCNGCSPFSRATCRSWPRPITPANGQWKSTAAFRLIRKPATTCAASPRCIARPAILTSRTWCRPRPWSVPGWSATRRSLHRARTTE